MDVQLLLLKLFQVLLQYLLALALKRMLVFLVVVMDLQQPVGLEGPHLILIYGVQQQLLLLYHLLLQELIQ